MSEKKEQIIQSATQMIRHGGYNAFSFREIAEAIGIKSSSVHYYFRRKEDLAAVVAKRYSDAFLNVLGDPKALNRNSKSILAHYGNAFINAFKGSGKACLCSILSHESPAIPQSVLLEIDSFVDKNIDWLTAAFRFASGSSGTKKFLEQARVTYTALNGAMAVATLKQDAGWIKSIQSYLIQKSG